MSNKQRSLGQYFTGPEVVDLALGFCMRSPGDRILDPSCGQGAFLMRAAQFQKNLAPDGKTPDRPTLWGIEIDNEASKSARSSLSSADARACILTEDFFSLMPGGNQLFPATFDSIVGNPPYTRAEKFKQSLDLNERKAIVNHLPSISERLDSRTGLYAHFVVHSFPFIHPGGRIGFVLPNAWLDVRYGRLFKQFLLEHFKIIVIVESCVERWFNQAKVNTCLLILERCESEAIRARHKTRLVRLKKPLPSIVSCDLDDGGRTAQIENLVVRMLPSRDRDLSELSVRVIDQGALVATERWGGLLRTPAVNLNLKVAKGTIKLGALATVQRGTTTGANHFFYLSPEALGEWEIESKFTRPLLKSPKEITQPLIDPDDLRYKVLYVSDLKKNLIGTHVLQYIEWGESRNLDRRPTCANRPIWYALAESLPLCKRILWNKGIWNRHFAALVDNSIVIDQQFYAIYQNPELVPVLGAFLNSTWVALQAELLGRRNLGAGVLWFAANDVSSLQIPDPDNLQESEIWALEKAWKKVECRHRLPLVQQVELDVQKELDGIVFDLLGLRPADRRSVIGVAAELCETRMRQAKS